MSSRDEDAARAEFATRYAVPATDVVAGIERRVIGAAWGANGYTTLAQADELARRLGLSPASRVLDVGTGRGWPGVYFAARHGATVVGTDMPVDALVAAAGRHQPFRAGAFDAVVHTDVLC